MIKKYSSLGANEIEIYFRKIAQELQPINPAEVEASIAEGEGVDLGESAEQAKTAAEKLGKVLPTIQENFPDEKSLAEAMGAASEYGSNVPGVAEAKTAREKVRILKKFSRKVASLKSDKARLALFKKAGIITEGELIKIGKRLEERELVKIGGIGDEVASGIAGGLANTVPAALIPRGEALTGGAAEVGKFISGIPSNFINVETLGEKGMSVFERLKANPVGQAFSKGLGLVGKGVKWLGNTFKYLPAILDLVRGLVALVKCALAFGRVISTASMIGLSWWQPMISSTFLGAKVEEFAQNMEKLKIVGYVTGACKSFWQNIIEAILQGISGFINTILAAFNVVSTIAPGGIIASLIVGVGIGAAMEWVKGWLSSWAGGAASAGYVDVIKNIRALIGSNVGEAAGSAARTMMRSTPRRRRAV